MNDQNPRNIGETVTENVTTAAPQQIKRFEDMTKAEMADHLSRDHRRYLSANLTAHHDAVHEHWENSPDSKRVQINHGAIDHEHGALGLTDEQLAQVRAAKSDDDTPIKSDDDTPISSKPLSAGERKVLSTLVDNDFHALRNEMRQLASDALQGRIDRIHAEFAERVEEGKKMEAKAVKIIEAAQAKLDRLRDDAEVNGIKLFGAGTLNAGTGSEVNGMYEALSMARAENARALQRAELSLEQQRLAAQRKVLLSGVTQEAAALLKTIPSAKELMVEARREEAQRALEASQGQEG